MKKLFIIFGILALPLTVFSVTGENARFDWSLGQPTITDDTTNTCNDTAVARFDWVLGQAAIVHDSTANCTGTIALDQLHYHWRSDDGNESSASFIDTEDLPPTGDVFPGDRKRLRVLVSNSGTVTASNITYRLEYASSSCSTYTAVPAGENSLEWTMDVSPNVADGVATTDSSGTTNPGGKTFVAGYFKSAGNQTPAHSLTTSQFTELEYSLRSTVAASTGLTYCFRLTNAGSTTNFTYTATPQITLTKKQRPVYGGSGSGEGSGSGSEQSGGGGSGGSGSGEIGGGGGSVGGGGGGGGGGSE